MKSKEHFSEQVLDQTLLAVRREKRRSAQRRSGLVVCLLLATLAVFLRPASHEITDGLAQATEPDQNNGLENVGELSTDSAKAYLCNVKIFSSRDSALEVKRISMEEMSAMLADIPHGFYKTAEGKTRFWSPEIVQIN